MESEETRADELREALAELLAWSDAECKRLEDYARKAHNLGYSIPKPLETARDKARRLLEKDGG